MPAVLEPASVNRLKELSVKYKMPTVEARRFVYWYRVQNGEIVWREPQVAIVLQCNQRTIMCRLVIDDRGNRDVLKHNALHVTDPDIQLTERASSDLNGCWDFTDADKADEKWRADVTERLEALEAAATKPVTTRAATTAKQ